VSGLTGPIQVEAATLHAAAGNVRSTRQDVDGELRKLLGVVDELSGAWQGQASTGFQNLMQRWNSDSQALLSALGEIADLLDKAGTQHTVNDEQQQQMFGKYDGALGGGA
jgi:ESAT-6 family protein